MNMSASPRHTAEKLFESLDTLSEFTLTTGTETQELIKQYGETIVSNQRVIARAVMELQKPPTETPDTLTPPPPVPDRHWAKVAASAEPSSIEWQVATCLDALAAPQVRPAWFAIGTSFALTCFVFGVYGPPIIREIRMNLQGTPALGHLPQEFDANA
jgi:hypothetical protein